MEVWKDIAGYEGLYQISRAGAVRSLRRYNEDGGHHLLQVLQYGKREVVYLWRQGKGKRYSVKALLREVFGSEAVTTPQEPRCKTLHEIASEIVLHLPLVQGMEAALLAYQVITDALTAEGWPGHK